MATGMGQLLQVIQQQQAIKERRIEQKAGFLNAAINREHEITKMDKAHDNAKEQYNAQMSLQYPGATINEDTGYIDLQGYDFTKSTDYKTQNIGSITEELMSAGLSTDGSFDELSKRLMFYKRGANRGISHLGSNIDPLLSAEIGGDRSQGVMTPTDIDDFKAWYQEDPDNPMVLTKMVQMGYASPDMGLQTINGLYTHTDESREHIDNYLKGFEFGLAQNQRFKTNNEYLAGENAKMLSDIQIGEAVAGSAFSQKATKDLASSKAAIGNAINSTWSEDGVAVMAWNTGDGIALVEIEDIEDNINEVLSSKNVSSSDINGFISFVKQLSFIGQDGSGTESVLEYLRNTQVGKPGSTGAKYMQWLGVFRPELVKALGVGVNIYSKIDKASSVASQWIKTNSQDMLNKPTTQATPFQAMLGKNKFVAKFNKLRALDAQNMENTPEYKKIKADIQMSIKGVQKTDPEMFKKLMQWLELEMSLSDLGK